MASNPLVARVVNGRVFRGFSVFTFVCVMTGVVLAQAEQAPAPAPATDSAAPADANGNGNGRMRRGQNGGDRANRGNFDPAQMQQQMMDRLREQFGVTDDAEWKIISDRVTALNELRRTTGGFGGFGGFRGQQNGAAGQAAGARPGRTTSPETDALRQAVTDKLPDAEIKSRLDRVREVRKANEEKMAKVQEELRAVLSVRQEAVAVMYGLLP